MADSAPVHEMSRECANLLVVAAEQGEPISEGRLREELGVGHDDLRGMLAQLSDRGMASEVAPGSWTAGVAEAESMPEPVVVSVAERAEASPRLADAPDARQGRGERQGRDIEQWLQAGVMVDATVRITRGIAHALDAEALGKLLLAGLADTGDDDVFVLEIVP